MARGFRLTAATALHQGDRATQQDQVLLMPHPYVRGCVLGVVADGMGGRSGGRKAADQVLLTARQLFERYAPDSERAADLLQQMIEDAHTLIKLTALSSTQEPHSTVAAFLINPRGDGAWIHAGDSRIYQFRRGRLVRRTHDHSYVEMMVQQGQLSEDEARLHPKANLLLGCLGMRHAPPPLDIHPIEGLHPGDALLACSDGLWHHFSADEMGGVIAARPPREAAALLTQEARRRAKGMGDNLCLALVRVEALP